MYNIADLIEVILCLILVYNINSVIYEFVNILPDMNQITKGILSLDNFLLFISENNTLYLEFYDNIIEEQINPSIVNADIDVKNEIVQKVEQKYEDKYLEKFKRFPNEFQFNELELEEERKEFENIKITNEQNRFQSINQITEQLNKIDEIEKEGNITYERNLHFTEKINEIGIYGLLNFFNLKDDYDDDPDDIDFEQLYINLIGKKNELKKELKFVEENILGEEEMRLEAREIIVNRKLDKFIDNYILECTPLGNIYMRYNNSKKSFEYFSNSTMPYRYLEPVGRKYVMTYWCKPIFIDIEDELKKSEEKFEEEKKKKEEEEADLKTGTGSKNMLAKLKSYNKDTKNQATMKPQMKNRGGSNFALPPQIKANLPNVNQNNEKQYLKEHANRYTCEGRLTGFSPLKKIDKKISDKKLTMSYADFKRMKKEEQNKK
jgi:hypothetical protein